MLLGPGPAVAVGVIAAIVDAAIRRISFKAALNLIFTYAAFPIVGGLLVRAIIGDVHDPHTLTSVGGFGFGLVVFGVFLDDERAELRADQQPLRDL